MGVRPYSKVVWSEGMHLAQHHFQAQSRYLEASASFALSRLCFKPYGFLRLALDGEAIREGSVSILEARGVMPDGLAFEFPQGDPLPTPLDAGDMGGGGGEPATVYLGVPAFRPGRANCDPFDGPADGTEPDHRYRAETANVQDENTGSDRRDLLLASKNFRLVFAPAVTEDLVALPMARVQRGPSGQFEFIHDFIPPSLHIGATPRLAAILGGLVEMLRSKGEVMAQRRAMVGDDLADLSSEEVLDVPLHPLRAGLTEPSQDSSALPPGGPVQGNGSFGRGTIHLLHPVRALGPPCLRP
jgi:type VI secretion system protein ImpJ